MRVLALTSIYRRLYLTEHRPHFATVSRHRYITAAIDILVTYPFPHGICVHDESLGCVLRWVICSTVLCVRAVHSTIAIVGEPRLSRCTIATRVKGVCKNKTRAQ